MPKTQKPPVARGERWGKHRKKRLKMLEAKPHWLANDAPYGKYRVDFVAMELFLRCPGLSTYGEDELLRLFREDVSIAASLATMFTRVRLVWRVPGGADCLEFASCRFRSKFRGCTWASAF
jgi:hypothetical protein